VPGDGRTRRARFLSVILALAVEELVIGAVASLVLVSLFIVLGALVAGQVIAIDRAVSLTLHAFASPPLTAAMRLVTRLGEAIVGVPLLVLLAARLWGQRRPGLAVLIVVSWLGGWAIDALAKLVFARARPTLFEWLTTAPGYSFPSGHTLSAVVTFGLLAYLAGRERTRRQRTALAAGAVAIMLLVALSRIYLGVHYFTDVLGSFLVGSAWLLATVVVLRHAESRGW
jgi:undecaprenyl-diphosphatase